MIQVTSDHTRPRIGPVCAIGNFDGVHPGHRRLFSICRDMANAAGTDVCAITFDGLRKGGGRLFCSSDREALLREAGADRVIVENFGEICDMSPEAYIDERLVAGLSPSAVVCGADFRFGRGGSGDASVLGRLLAAHGIPLTVAETVMIGGAPVSTSRIKAALADGDAETAAALLGRRFSFAYPVKEGKHLGRLLGAPTANEYFPDEMFVPKFGVYAGEAEADEKVYPCVINIGIRPTVDDGDRISAESYLIGYDGDLYGRCVRVRLTKFLRDEMKFPSVDALAAQIQCDAGRALAVYNGERKTDN